MKISFLFLVIICSSCGKYQAPVDNHGAVYTHPTEYLSENHRGNDSCYLCHVDGGLHTEDRNPGTAVDLAWIKLKIAQKGLDSCVECHKVKD